MDRRRTSDAGETKTSDARRVIDDLFVVNTWEDFYRYVPYERTIDTPALHRVRQETGRTIAPRPMLSLLVLMSEQ